MNNENTIGPNSNCITMRIIKRVKYLGRIKVYVEQKPQKRTIIAWNGQRQHRIFPYTLFEVTYGKFLFFKTFVGLRIFLANEPIKENTMLMTPFYLGGVFINGKVCMPDNLPYTSFWESKIINKAIGTFWNSKFTLNTPRLNDFLEKEWEELTLKNKIPKVKTDRSFKTL